MRGGDAHHRRGHYPAAPAAGRPVCDGSQAAFFVRIVTGEGVESIGEGDSIPSVLEAIFSAPISNSIGMGLRDLLIGQDPLQIEPMVQRLWDGTLYPGGASARLTAISAAEIALWDLKRKIYGAPVSELLGGRYRERLRAPVPASSSRRTRPTSITCAATPSASWRPGLRQSSSAGVASGRIGGRTSPWCERRGRHCRLMIDVGLCWDLTNTLERAHALAESDLYWLGAHRADSGDAGRLVWAPCLQHWHRLGRLAAPAGGLPARAHDRVVHGRLSPEHGHHHAPLAGG